MGPSAMANQHFDQVAGDEGEHAQPQGSPHGGTGLEAVPGGAEGIAHCSARDHAGQLDAPVPEAVNDRRRRSVPWG